MLINFNPGCKHFYKEDVNYHLYEVQSKGSCAKAPATENGSWLQGLLAQLTLVLQVTLALKASFQGLASDKHWCWKAWQRGLITVASRVYIFSLGKNSCIDLHGTPWLARLFSTRLRIPISSSIVRSQFVDFSPHQVIPVHTMQAGYHYSANRTHIPLTSVMVRWSVLIVEGFYLFSLY